MYGRNYFCEIKKHSTLMKETVPTTKHSNLQGKKIFKNNYFGSQPFIISCYFTAIVVHFSVIAPVCYFSVYKWIGWDSANIYLFKINSRSARKRYEIYPKLTINTIKSRSGVFTVNFEMFLLLTLNR